MAEMKKSALGDWKARKAGEKSEEKAEKQYYKTHKVGYYFHHYLYLPVLLPVHQHHFQ